MRAMSYSDLQLAWMLLDGEVEEAQGRRRTRYLEEGMELKARTAIARLLRSEGPLDRHLRDSLAGLFDPNPPAWEQRKITIVGRRPGELKDHVRDTHIAYDIWEEVQRGGLVTAAIESAAEKFALSTDMVTKIWGGYLPLMERMHGPHRRGRR